MTNPLFPDYPESIKKNFLEQAVHLLRSTKSNEWANLQKKYLVTVFKEASRTVEAYAKFLQEHSVHSSSVKTYTTFETVPVVTKKGYLRKYPWNELCKKNSLTRVPLVMTSTSGSTGEPFYFPRTKMVDIQSAMYHQMFLGNACIPKKSSILVIDCFGMGVWIGGLITYQAFAYVSEQGYPLSIITPGINKREIFQALRNVATSYDVVILCGYPPFIKDVIDDGEEQGIVWSDYSLKIIFAAEGFSETFRDYIVEKASLKNLYRDTMNIYGSADLGTMAEETPLCIMLRRLALQNSVLYFRLFGQATRLPTLAQYIPSCVSFESKNGSILCTGDNALPLVRYEIGDNGGVFRYDDVKTICQEEGIDLIQEMKNIGIGDTLTELPFVYVYERSDFSASFYGALIYPEFIKKALSSKEITVFLTGKFTMYTKNDAHENQYLEINVELKKNQKSSAQHKAMVTKAVYSALIEQSAEYGKITESLGKRALPKIIFWPHGDETHFAVGAKQKWVKKV